MDATKSSLNIKYLKAALLPCSVLHIDKKLADIFIAFFFTTSNISRHCLSLTLFCCCKSKRKKKLFRRKLVQLFDFCMLTMKKRSEIVYSIVHFFFRLVKDSLTKQIFRYPVVPLPFTVYQVAYASFIISYVTLQWFTLITGAEGYSMPLHKRTHVHSPLFNHVIHSGATH